MPTHLVFVPTHLVVMPTNLVVILSEAKDPDPRDGEILRWRSG